MVISVEMKDSKYDIVIERGSLNKVSDYLNVNRKVLIVTDSNIPLEYINVLKREIKESYV